MLRSIAELAAYGTLATLLAVASLTPEPGNVVSSATTTVASAGSSHPATIRATTGSDRGSLLFATKGCIGCHMHAAFPGARMQVGPDLTGLPDRAATRVAGLDAKTYVRQSLRDPGAFRVPSSYSNSMVMPDLHLSDAEIEALTEFLLTPTG